MADKILLENSDGSVLPVNELPIVTAIGFTGSVQRGLIFDYDRRRVFYPLGKTIVLRSDASFTNYSSEECKSGFKAAPHSKGPQQKFLSQHSHNISTLALSSSGQFLISGELTPNITDKAEVIIWNVEHNGEVLHRYRLHSVGVKCVQISPNDIYAASIGKEDPSVLLLKDLKSGALISGKKVFGQPFVPMSLSFLPGRDDVLVVGGLDALVLWRVDEEKKLSCVRITFGKIKRSVSDLFVKRVSKGESIAMCGTTSGDIVKVSLLVKDDYNDTGKDILSGSLLSCLIKKTPKKDARINAGKFAGGVTCLQFFKDSDKMIVGTGCGELCIVQERARAGPSKNRTLNPGVPTKVSEPTQSHLIELKTLSLSEFPITSIIQYDRSSLFVGTKNGDIFHIDTLTYYSPTLVSSSSSSTQINSLAFPKGLDSICLATSSDGFRLWQLQSGTELLHVRPNESGGNNKCTVAEFSPLGDAILSGWSDGSLRIFSPQSGSTLGVTGGVHPSGVSTLAFAANRGLIFTGGNDGQLRGWTLSSPSSWKLSLSCTLRQHKKQIISLQVNNSGSECLSGSKDGTAVIWDVTIPSSIQRKRILVGSCSLVGASYHSSESQIITLSIDGRLSYWDTCKGIEIRSFIISHYGVTRALDVFKDFILTGTELSTLKIRRYKAGDIIGVGRGHVGSISSLKMSPSGAWVVIGTEDGALIVFDVNL
ncbi:uncharacterized protein [Lepeophtheirus salmonis]|uniref:uncharacterized protein isoform X1 n=1 Tax=Lepeophtheirus salmonis TaxID=72036 RepID=UPI001AE8A081|nr:cilia- and flagella-associated protein 52-like isoform X1 [Lepeophtheirus salmonis]